VASQWRLPYNESSGSFSSTRTTKEKNTMQAEKRSSRAISAALALALVALLPVIRAYADDIPLVNDVASKLKFGQLMQFWYVNDNTLKTSSNFRMRRAETRFDADITPNVSSFLMIDPAKIGATGPGNNILQDFGIVYKDDEHLPGASVQIGQFKVPFGMEGTASSGEILTPERSFLSFLLKWSDFRDIGAMATAKYKLADTILLTGYIGVFNGEGPNAASVNNDKATAGRVTIDLPEGFHIGGSIYSGKDGGATANSGGTATGTPQLFERKGLEFAYNPPELPLTLRGEAAGGHQGGGSYMWTYYGLIGYTFWDKFQPVIRYDVWSVDGKTNNDIFNAGAADWQREVTYGVNYYIKGHNAKIQAAYTTHQQDTTNPAGDIGGTVEGIFRLAFQVKY
jgi:hypothetical protein